MDDRTLRQLQALGGDVCALWAEAAAVVCLRSLKLVKGGPEGLAEAQLMISEKFRSTAGADGEADRRKAWEDTAWP
jgi:hypothetical protein